MVESPYEAPLEDVVAGLAEFEVDDAGPTIFGVRPWTPVIHYSVHDAFLPPS